MKMFMNHWKMVVKLRRIMTVITSRKLSVDCNKW
ncbi:hypothetical protein TcasGA2_TC032849 [Tribolium castaneum]|uniref:Uncharacterized protein n=1 Tax=Tribolium castaneum TaxID=7070 RepID=A0A139WJI6_TRICA|nr:hypothetical protein TcasGA2_TC032849 [Tribolium castaneum]